MAEVLALRKGGNLRKGIMGLEAETGLGGNCLRHLSLMLIPNILGKCPLHRGGRDLDEVVRQPMLGKVIVSWAGKNLYCF